MDPGGPRREIVMNERATRAKKVFEPLVLLAALAVVPVVLIEARATSQSWLEIAYLANWVIWVVFLVEYVVVVALSDDKWAYTKSAWLDIVIILVSFPLLPAVLASTRLARLARLGRALRILRLVRAAAAIARAGQALRRILGKRKLGYLITVSFVLATAFGALLVLVEPNVGSVEEGVWWAIVTLTTVGYGDLYPQTLEGRIVGVVLMMLSIVFVATMTAVMAASFVEDDRPDMGAEIAELNDRLERIEMILRGEAPPELPLADDAEIED